jgi:hypothetical protein
MRPPPTHLAPLTAIATLLAWASPSYAQQGFSDGWEPQADVVDYSDSFTGQFTGVEARFLLSNGEGEGLEGWGVDVGPRVAFPMGLGDFRLAYRYDALGAPEAPGGASTTHSVGGSFAVHPLYLLLLGSDWISYVAGSLYLDVGLGGQYSALTVGDETRATPGFFWSWGGGIDVPLWDPDVGWAPWVNVSYRNHRGLGPDGAGEARWDSTHSLMLGLGLRFNRLPW